MNGKEAFEAWYKEQSDWTAKELAQTAWQAALEWAATQHKPVTLTNDEAEVLWRNKDVYLIAVSCPLHQIYKTL